MGLDAVVYRNVDNVVLDQESEPALVDGHTGEVYFHDPQIAKKYGEDAFIALHRRLGNVSSIDSLRSQVPKDVVGELPILINKVLFSGSHSGDIVSVGMLDSLEAEIDLLRQRTCGSRSLALTAFLEDIIDMIRAARRERNPIVFV